uniref:Uncharacterized protein n=1 Tax=Arundo donax TaxID=35708 RepID=A0A0A9G7S1_ARUDO
MALNIFEPRYRLMVQLSQNLDALLSDTFVSIFEEDTKTYLHMHIQLADIT